MLNIIYEVYGRQHGESFRNAGKAMKISCRCKRWDGEKDMPSVCPDCNQRIDKGE